MWRSAKAAAELVRSHKSDTVHIVTHIDADALSAAGVAATALRRARIEYKVTYCKSLDDAMVKRLNDENPALSWYTDLGSAVHHRLPKGDKIITDHHAVPDGEDALAFPHINPHLHGIDEEDSISGAGCAYYVATALDSHNGDLAATALVGALGDLQDQRLGKFTGLNRKILADAEAHGVMRSHDDLRFFGRSSRPLPRFLRYADPAIPGLGLDEDQIVDFLVTNRIRVRDGGRWRTWFDLDDEERDRLTTAIMTSYGAGVPLDKIRGENYDMLKETEPELRCAKEFATLLNSTARYDRPEIGLALTTGERQSVLSIARTLLQGHRRSLGGAIQYAQKQGLTDLGPLAYFHAGNHIRDTILGIVTGILLGGGQGGGQKVLVGLADNGQGGIKVSTRAPDLLVQRGANLSQAVSHAASAVGGSGGGHAGAAGATLPLGREDEFLKALADALGRQLTVAVAN